MLSRATAAFSRRHFSQVPRRAAVVTMVAASLVRVWDNCSRGFATSVRGLCFSGVARWRVQDPPTLSAPSTSGDLGRRAAATKAKKATTTATTRTTPTTPQQASQTPKTQLAEVISGLESRTSALKRQITSLEANMKDPNEAWSEAEAWRLKGEQIKSSSADQWHSNTKEIKVKDYNNLNAEGQPCETMLQLPQAGKGQKKNAQHCFKMAQKLERAAYEVPKLVESAKTELEKRIAQLAAARKMSEVADAQAVRTLHSELQKEDVLQASTSSDKFSKEEELKQKAAADYRRKYGKDIDCFRSPNGFDVVVGRTSRTNEEVSLTIGKGDMPWFHAADIPGSHVVIRASSSIVNTTDVNFAAAIAAYHSKARNDSTVPVTFCEAGHVRKMKGAPVGTVFISGPSKRLRVKPKLPDSV